MKKLLFILSATITTAISAQAVLVINIQEAGPDVQITLSGSIDLTGATPGGIFTIGPTFINPTDGDVLGLGGSGDGYVGAFAVLPPSFGTGGQSVASSSFGDVTYLGTFGLMVPFGYVSNTALNASSTYLGQSFGTLGITPGTYNFTFTSGDTGSIIASTSAIPEPSTYIAFGGFAMLGAFLWRRRRQLKGAKTSAE